VNIKTFGKSRAAKWNYRLTLEVAVISLRYVSKYLTDNKFMLHGWSTVICQKVVSCHCKRSATSFSEHNSGLFN
jgi:hypothetical protein